MPSNPPPLPQDPPLFNLNTPLTHRKNTLSLASLFTPRSIPGSSALLHPTMYESQWHEIFPHGSGTMPLLIVRRISLHRSGSHSAADQTSSIPCLVPRSSYAIGTDGSSTAWFHRGVSRLRQIRYPPLSLDPWPQKGLYFSNSRGLRAQLHLSPRERIMPKPWALCLLASLFSASTEARSTWSSPALPHMHRCRRSSPWTRTYGITRSLT
ncbi:hypothetical protein MKX07_000823 [Trichoderma sp. CBMAI-0711]|nr:hypothetical protein MKX07_000823 [Trichoderma sp. CBMAI-0711]